MHAEGAGGTSFRESCGTTKIKEYLSGEQGVGAPCALRSLSDFARDQRYMQCQSDGLFLGSERASSSKSWQYLLVCFCGKGRGWGRNSSFSTCTRVSLFLWYVTAGGTVAVIVRSIPKCAKTRDKGEVRKREGWGGRANAPPLSPLPRGGSVVVVVITGASPFTLCRRVAAHCHTPGRTHIPTRATHAQRQLRVCVQHHVSLSVRSGRPSGKCHFGTLDLARLPSGVGTGRAHFRATSDSIKCRVPGSRLLEGSSSRPSVGLLFGKKKGDTATRRSSQSLALPPTCPPVVLSRMTTLLFLALLGEPRCALLGPVDVA